VGFRKNTGFDFSELKLPPKGEVKLGSILHPENGTEEPEGHFTFGEDAVVNSKYTLTEKLWQYLQGYKEKHAKAGNGFGYSVVGPEDVSRTLSARYHKDGSEILGFQGENKPPRRLTPRECARLMGYDDDFKIPVSDTQAYRQFGNSVAVPVFKEVARIMAPHIAKLCDEKSGNADVA
jgi:DNA (cytosine-5)-methyltransferase 1